MKRLIDVSSKRVLADTVIKNAKIIDVFNLAIIHGDIAITDGMIVGIGDYQGKEVIDAEGRYMAPSFIDGHVHIESSMVTPKEFAKVVLPHGVTTVITDPHEIANVSGTDGIQFMLDDSEGLDLDVFVMLSSSVPATAFENAGATLNNEHLEPFYNHPRVLGLAEVMDFPAVKNADQHMLEKLEAAKKHRNHIDGHCAGFDEDGINIYRAAGIKTDHESISRDEIQMRISRGMHVMIREGTTAKNLEALIGMVTPANARRFLFCTDDKHIDDLLYEGSIDHHVRLAIQHGMDPLQAIQLASLNAAECFSLTTKGAIAPGYEADFLLLDNLDEITITEVYRGGKLVAKDGVSLGNGKDNRQEENKSLRETVNLLPISVDDLQIPMGQSAMANVIEVIPDQVTTGKIVEEVSTENGYFIPSADSDLAKIAVIERHHRTGNIGLGIVKGLGLLDGAIASTVAHDSHNLVIAGTNDEDMMKAMEAVAEMNGGLVVVRDGKVIGKIELAISGLMSDKNYEAVMEEIQSLNKALSSVTDQKTADTFITLAFLSLPVIPSLKLTDQGLFDVDRMEFISVPV
ncbi:adenine deaminase [Oceanobacillus piezotolerans]|uniref:Adenine deaminase n=1 Tax=Oceanobacillus piezotolerans TaxID=2448030 RepID=A0A498D672_9BACI|nr:adenine deaminase [Oceanobacillus piezotolerans]RLL40634.1 adenine deaminase [Oceanobacillus piezotolerans]